jgi:uncharacterized membrane protein YadS
VRRPQWLPTRPDLPGLALATFLGIAALLLARALPPSPFVSDILIAMVLGALVLNTPLRAIVGLELPSAEREPDRYAAGLRFTGKWVLRAGIIAMGLKVQTSFFGTVELALIAGVALAALPSAFFVAHSLAATLGVRRPMADLLAGGTMICGASAVNAIAPLAGARRDEQGIAIGVVFLFSVVALVAFRPIAAAIGLEPSFAGLWSGLAVNDLSSAVAVGSQMGGAGGVMAAASKSVRVVLLAPTLVAFALLRRDLGPTGNQSNKASGIGKSIADQLPMFVLGYVAFAIVRAAGDRAFGSAPAWAELIRADKLIVDVLMVTVGASIGLHLGLRSLLATSTRAIAVGGGASMWMASITLAMVASAARGAHAAAALIGLCGVLVSFAAFRALGGKAKEASRLRQRFESGAPLSLAEAKRLLAGLELEGALDEGVLRRALTQLHPTIGELIPVRESPLPHGEGCRWVTYWEGQTGWALVALCREPGSATPIHAHPHRLIGKAIEGVLEELRFSERQGGLELISRKILGHNDLVETDGLSTVHLVRAVGATPAIDLQLRGPEAGMPGRRFRTAQQLDLDALAVGARVVATEEIDDRPGHGGEGAAAGRPPVVVAG